jgi:hypothetical protein
MDVVARDFKLELPNRGSAGIVRFRFVNEGREPHYARFVRVEGDHSLADFEGWRHAGGPLPAWLIPAGGIGTIAPGESVEYSTRLIPGEYIAYCGHPSPDGVPHVDKGMYARFTIEPADRNDKQEPSAVGTVVLADDRIDVSEAFRSGARMVHIRNAGSRSHQALLVELPNGVTAATELDWFRGGSRRVRPGHPMGGAIEVTPGSDAWVTFNLRQGSYMLLSTSRTPSGTRDFDLGLMTTFRIE